MDEIFDKEVKSSAADLRVYSSGSQTSQSIKSNVNLLGMTQLHSGGSDPIAEYVNCLGASHCCFFLLTH